MAVTRRPSETAMPADLLAAVLERVEAEEGEPGDVAVGCPDRVVDAEDAAHQARPPSRRGHGRVVTSPPASASGSAAAPIRDRARRRPCRSRAAAGAPASSRSAATSSGRADTTTRPSPSPNRSSASAASAPTAPAIAASATHDGEAAGGDVVRASQQARAGGGGQELVQRRARRPGRARGCGPPARPARLLVGGAVQRRGAVAGQQHDVAGLAGSRRARPGRRPRARRPRRPPASAWIGRPKCSL